MHAEWDARVRSDYAYVKRELREITLLASSLFLILIVLWLVIEVA